MFLTSSSIDHTNNKANSYMSQDLWWLKFTWGVDYFIGVYGRLEFNIKRNLKVYWIWIGPNRLILTLSVMVNISRMDEF